MACITATANVRGNMARTPDHDTKLPTEPEPESIDDKAEEAGIGVDDTNAQQASIIAEKHKMSQEAAERAGIASELDPDNPYDADQLEDDEGTDDGGYEGADAEDTVQQHPSDEDDDKPGSTKPPEDEVGKSG